MAGINSDADGDHKISGQSEGASIQISADASQSTAPGSGLSIRVRKEVNEAKELVKTASLVSQKGGDLTPRGEDQPQDQLECLLEELGRIEVQQNKLRDAVKHNKGIVVHPRQEVLQEEEDPDTPKPATPKKIIVSGGFCGFGIAEDLLRIDFSTPEEAPEEYKAVAFFEEARTVRPGVSDAERICKMRNSLIKSSSAVGSFGLCDPASKEMHEYLLKLEEQQKKVLELITGKKQELIEKYSGTSVLKEAKPKRSKSRLSKNNRLAATENKEAMSDILGIPRLEAVTQPGKGSLAQKLPLPANQIIAAQQTAPIVANRAIVAAPPAHPVTVAPRPRPVFQQPYKVAEVQKSDEARKVQEELSSEFAKPLPGSTPSTQHLAKKKPAVNEEDSASPYYSESPQADPKPMSKTTKLMKNFSMTANGSANAEKKPKAGFMGGFRKMLSKN